HRAPILVAIALDDTPGIGIEQQRLRIERVSGAVWSAHAQGVAGSRLQQRSRHLPDIARSALEVRLIGDPVEIGLIEHDELDRRRVPRPHAQRRCTVVQTHAEAVEGSASWGSEIRHEYSVEAKNAGE